MKRTLLLLILVAFSGMQARAATITNLTTDKGVNVWFSRNAALPIFSLRLSFEHSGSAYDPEGKEGAALFLAAMMTEGAGELDSAAFHEALEDKAITLSVSASKDRLMVSLDALSEHRKAAFRLLRAILTAPRLDDSDMGRVRQELLSDLARSSEDPNYVASVAFDAAAFEGHAYARPALGTKASLSAINKKDLAEYFLRHVTRDALTVSLSGDMTPEDAASLLSETLDALPVANEKIAPLPQVDLQHLGRKSKEFNAPQTVILFALPAVARNDPKFFAAYLLNYALGGSSLTSRLGQEIRRNHGLSYYVSTALDIDASSHLLKGGMAVRNDRAQKALQLMEGVLDEVAQKGISQKEVSAAKDYVIGSFPLSIDTNREFASYMQMMQWFDLGIDYLDRRSDLFRKVTLGEVNRVARELLDLEKLLIVKVGGKAVNNVSDNPKR